MDLFGNESCVSNTRPAKRNISLETNGGDLQTTQVADVSSCGEVHFDSEARTNVPSFANAAKKFQIECDNAVEDVFKVCTPDGVRCFGRTPNNVCALEAKQSTSKAAMVNTLQENVSFHSDRQVAQAKRACHSLHGTGSPSIADLKLIVRTNAICNNPVTSEDIALAETVFGKDVGPTMGKLTQSKPLPVVHNCVAVPPEFKAKHRKLTLCVDTFFVNGLAFLGTTSEHLMCRTAGFLEDRTVLTHHTLIDEVFACHNAAGFTITHIHCDLEFKPMFDSIKNKLHVCMKCAGKDEHVPEQERSNRLIKE